MLCHIIINYTMVLGEIPLLKCDHCSTTFRQKEKLHLHVKMFHTSDKPIESIQCSEVFPNRNQYKVMITKSKLLLVLIKL